MNHPKQGYLKLSLKGLSWTAALRIASRGMTIVRTAILARILLPEQFGAFGVAAMALALLEILTETGINVVLLQEKKNFEDYIDTAWLVSIGRGVVIALAIFLATPYVAEFFGSEQSRNLLYLICLVPLIRGFINPSCVRFIKELRFDKEFAYRFIILAAEAGVSIYAAIVTQSAMSFVWGLIVASLVEVFVSWIVISPRPRFNFNLAQVKEVLNRGKWVTGFGFFDYLFTQGDNIVVGRLLGPTALGLYRTSYSFSTLPVTEVSESYYKVMFPTFVNMAQEPARLKRAVIKGAAVVAGLMLVAGTAIYTLAQPLVIIILGETWTSAIPIVRILAFVGVFRGLSYLFNSFFVAIGKQKYVTGIIFTSMVGLVLTIFPLVNMYGVVGAGYAAVFASIVSLPVTAILAIKAFKSL